MQSKAEYFKALRDAIHHTEVEGGLELALKHMRRCFDQATTEGKKVIFIGNGGSSSIASHMASDISKNGGVRAIAFNDISTLTMLGNDFGYESVFEKQLEFYGFPGDILVAISSSGGSQNIVNAAKKAAEKLIKSFTFTGEVKTAENTLKTMGELNFVVPSTDYGIVEIAHLSLIHSVI